MAGAAGENGGCGYVVSKYAISLKKGSTVRGSIGRIGAGPSDGGSYAGGTSYLYIDSSLTLKAGGGTGARVESSDGTVHEAGGLGGSNAVVHYHHHTPATAPSITMTRPKYSDGGINYGKRVNGGTIGCWTGHLHGTNTTSRGGCVVCECERNEDGSCKSHRHPRVCGLEEGVHPTCGYEEGQVDGYTGATPGTCSGGDSASLSNRGNGYFSVKLADQNNIQFDNQQVKLPHYKDVEVQLIIKDDAVIYYKRK